MDVLKSRTETSEGQFKGKKKEYSGGKKFKR